MKYFLDNCLSPKYAAMLTALSEPGTDVVALRHYYPVNEKDKEWIPEVGTNGWILITKDRKQRSKPEERRALVENSVTAFYLAKSFDSQPLMEVAWRLVKYWTKITMMAEAAKKGTLFLVDINGGIGILLP